MPVTTKFTSKYVTNNTNYNSKIPVNMTQSGLAGECNGRNFFGGRTIVVGVKLDSESRELLTWALVKAAHAGDRVIALHVLTNNKSVDHDRKPSLLSLVKTFDSILAVYEGFCNLKQVDLKLKICSGSSIRKIIVREAKSYGCNEIIVGTATSHHAIKSSSSVAKYCARKLSKNCSIIAVNNGKIVFHRDSSSSPSNVGAKESSNNHKNLLLSVFHKSLSLNPNLIKNVTEENNCNQIDWNKLEVALVKTSSDCTGNNIKYNCSICSPDSVLPSTACVLQETCDDKNYMALVPVQNLEASRDFPELTPGWPLLRRAISSNRLSSDRSPARQISVVQWAMRLPVRNQLLITNSDLSDKKKDKSLNVENGAIVLVHGDEIQYDLCSSVNTDSSSLPEELEGLHEKYSSSCRLFKFEELVAATMNFKPENMIGKGGNSQVYRGCLPDGRELAVKILKTSEDVVKEFVLEVEIITALHHENIISLFGFCFEDNKLLLVYDLLSRGSLEDNLHGMKKENIFFGWSERYKVAVGVAEALAYLHSRCDKPVIHRDVKSSNILLSDNFEPQLSDFGLSKWATPTGLHITSTDVAGTFGYLAPEYFMHGKVTEKIDVYAFGVVLLELLTGRKPISSAYPKGEESLVMWANPILNSGKFARLLDQSLRDRYDPDQMERMVLASTLCIRRVPRTRPQMTTVLKLLQGNVEVTKWAWLERDSTGGSNGRLHISNIPEEADGFGLVDEGFSESNLRSHLNLALLDIEDSSLSMSSIEESISIEDYLRGRWSRSSSFD